MYYAIKVLACAMSIHAEVANKTNFWSILPCYKDIGISPCHQGTIIAKELTHIVPSKVMNMEPKLTSTVPIQHGLNQKSLDEDMNIN